MPRRIASTAACASVYSQAEAVIGVECHSPSIALPSGTPTFYIRQPTDTCKGQMYRDIRANDRFFEIDEASGRSGGRGSRRFTRIPLPPKPR